MPRDADLITKRNTAIRAAYDRLISEEVQVVLKGGQKVFIRVNYNQVMTLLAQLFFLSPRTLEPIITATSPVPTPIKTASTAYSEAATSISQ